MAAMLLTGTSAAYAAEVPAGGTEVKIPLALESDFAIAGVEIAFNQSSGLEYVRFEPASGAENPIKTTTGGNTWVGFFSATNKYLPLDGVLNFGNLVFRYSGDNSENVTIEETRLHSLTGADSEVTSVRGKPNTVIPVTRKASDTVGRNNDPILVSTQPSGEGNSGASDSSGAGDTGGVNGTNDESGPSDASDTGGAKDTSGKNGTNGSSDAKGKSGKTDSDDANAKSAKSGSSSTNGSNSASSSSNASGDAGSVNGGSSRTTPGSVAVSETVVGSEEAEASAMVPFSIVPEIVSDQDIPLTSNPGQPANTEGELPVWWIAAALIAGILAGALVIFIVLKRRRKNDGEPEVIKESYISSR
jgi:hypothetical protein